MSTDLNEEDDTILKCSETSWRAVTIHKMTDGTEKRKMANELGYNAVKLILELLRSGNSEIAIEIGMAAIQMFFDGHNYHQAISCIERLREPLEDSRLKEDVIEYETYSKDALKSSIIETVDNRIDILYSLIWENGCMGTSDAIKFFEKRTKSTITEPTILSYCKVLKFEQRIISFGGPTGRPIEMFPNNSISLNREVSYNKKNFFEGNLIAKNNLFKPNWDVPNRKNTRVYEIENGNDPRVFALIEPGESITSKFKHLGGISNMSHKLGVEGKLHPIKSIPEFGYEIIKNINDADFLTECKVVPMDYNEPID
ncbi:MAG: hypothetical protein O8C62_08075 [Candidatus Methanoperedens sp.]|nr:hypothetical protein [Candidatus Methanoperedens sp.]